MATKKGYLAIAISLTVLDVLVAIYYGRPVWTAWSADVWARALLVMLASLEVTSLANVWVRAISGTGGHVEPQSRPLTLTAVPVPIEPRGDRHV